MSAVRLGPDNLPRCSGHCCKTFSLPISPDQIKTYKRFVAAGKKRFLFDDGRRAKHYTPVDEIAKIIDMVIFKRVSQYDSATKKSVNKHNNVGRKHPRIYEYTCKNWDQATGNCMDYENRPEMCRNHGVNSCGYTLCTKFDNCPSAKAKELEGTLAMIDKALDKK